MSSVATKFLLVCAVLVSHLSAQDISMQPAKGISFRGDNVTLDLGGRVQVRHTYESEPNQSNFSVPRLRLALKGSVYENWKWELQHDFASNSLRDGLIEYSFSEMANLRFGQYKVRFDRQQLESSGRQIFADRSIAADNLGLSRDVGALFYGDAGYGVIQYSGGLFNGGGAGSANADERGHMIVTRLSVNPMGDFGLSQGEIERSYEHRMFIDLAFAQQPDGGEFFRGTSRIVAGVGYRYSGFYIAGEYYLRSTTADILSDALYLQASYLLIDELLDIAGRFSMYDPNKDLSDNQLYETIFGVNVYFHRLGHGLKLTTDMGFIWSEGSDDGNFRSRVQLQLVF